MKWLITAKAYNSTGFFRGGSYSRNTFVIDISPEKWIADRCLWDKEVYFDSIGWDGVILEMVYELKDNNV